MTSSTTQRTRRIVESSDIRSTHPPRPPPLASASRDARVLGRTLPHTDSIHPIAMLAQKVSVSAKTTAVVKTPVAKRGATIVRRNSKGGEEGARDFGNTYVFFLCKRGGAGRRSMRRMRAMRMRMGPSRANGWRRARAWMGADARA